MARSRALSVAFLAAALAFASVLPVRAETASSNDSAAIQLAQRSGDVHVNGYYRRDGTYVQPHMRSAPDGNPYNNYSYPGNVNPYTGKVAPGNPDTYLRNYGSGSSGSPRGYGTH